jgi:hypothetical protein
MLGAMATRSSILSAVALLVFLFAIATAPAVAVETPVGDLPVLALEEEEPEAEAAAEDVEVEEVCGEVDEEGFEEECEEVEVEPGRSAEECLLRSARAHASVDQRGKKLKLTIRYTTYEPVKAEIEIGKGANRIATVKRRLGYSGVMRIVKPLRKSQHVKRVVVSITIPSAKKTGCPSRRLALSPR